MFVCDFQDIWVLLESVNDLEDMNGEVGVVLNECELISST